MRMYNFKARNNLKRRALAFGLAIATLLGLTACGQKAPVEKAESSAQIVESKESTPTTPESSGDGKPTENSTANGKPSAEVPSAEVPSTEVPNADNPNADKPSADNDPPPERQEAGSDKEDEDGSAATGSTENGKPSSEQPSSEKTSTSKPSAESSKPSTEKPSSSKPSTPSTEAPSAGKPSTEKPSVEQPSSEAPSAEKPSAEKPSTEKPSSGLIGEVGEDPDGFTTDEELMKTCNGLHDYGPRNHAIVGQNEYINGTACYKRYEKEWETCVNCGVKNLISDGYHYYHQYTNPAVNYVHIVEGEEGCGKTCTVTSGDRCDCGMLNNITTTTYTGEHTYQKQHEWSNQDIRENSDGSRDVYHHWKDACLSCGDVRDEGWEFDVHLEPGDY